MLTKPLNCKSRGRVLSCCCLVLVSAHLVAENTGINSYATTFIVVTLVSIHIEDK